MTLFRKKRRMSPLMIGGLVLLWIIVLGAIWFLLSGGTRGAQPADPRVQARAKALEAAQGLELVGIEYPKVLRGEPSGTTGALSRAQSAFSTAQPELAKIDPAATDSVATAIASIAQKVSARAPADEVNALADSARTKLLALSKP